MTFLGAESIDVLRYRRSRRPDRAVHYVSLGCSRHPMVDPTAVLADPELGPRAEVVLQLRDTKDITGLARSLAIVAASPAVEGVVLMPDALVDLGGPLWAQPSVRVPFTAVLLGDSDIAELPLDPPRDPVRFLSATPITATEAAWVRLKGADAMRDGVAKRTGSTCWTPIGLPRNLTERYSQSLRRKLRCRNRHISAVPMTVVG